MKRRRRSDVSARRIRHLERALARLVVKNAPEDVLRQRAEIVLAQLASVSAAVLIANDHARYIDANPTAALLTGYSRAELLKKRLWDLTPVSAGSLGARLWRTFLRRGRMRGTYRLRRKDGTVVQARYVAVAHVLPGIHVSALMTAEPGRRLAPRRRPKSRRA